MARGSIGEEIIVHLIPSPYRVRSSDRTWIIGGLIGGGVLIIGAVVRVVVGGQDAATLGIALLVGALVIASLFGYARLRLKNATVYVKDDRVGITNALGFRDEIRIATVNHLERATVATGSRGLARINVLRIVASDGRRSLVFSGADRLDRGQLGLLRERLGVPISGTWSDE